MNYNLLKARLQEPDSLDMILLSVGQEPYPGCLKKKNVGSFMQVPSVVSSFYVAVAVHSCKVLFPHDLKVHSVSQRQLQDKSGMV